MKRCALLLTFCFLTLWAAAAQAQPAFRVADVDTTREDLVDPLFSGRDFAALGATLFFVHDDGIHGLELWKSDGTEAGTTLVKDVCPGACAGWPFGLTVSNGALYFAARDGVHGWELWRTDGTTANTRLVADLNPGVSDGLTGLFDLGGVLYLTADDGVHGNELWKTDGTAAGTQLVADLRPGPAGSSPRLWLDLGGGKLLFNADDGMVGREPWVTDGTAAGTVLFKDVRPGAGGSTFTVGNIGFENDACALGNGTFFFTADDGVHGNEPWISDGTAAGTVLLKDLNPGFDGSRAYGFTPLGGSVFFGAYDETVSWELWKTDGTAAGTALFKDINDQFGGSLPRQFTPFGGRLFFIAADNTAGRELWSTDGTVAGTALFKDINPGFSSSFSIFIRPVIRTAGGRLLFFADDGTHGNEPWASDGSAAGTGLVKDVAPGFVSSVPYAYSGLTVVGSTAFFHGFTIAHGFELWKSDGTAAGTAEVKNIAALTSGVPVELGFPLGTIDRVADRLVFDADDGVSGLEPWVTGGTAATTQQLADMTPGASWGGPTRIAPSAGLLVSERSATLWKTDGTPAGTSKLVPQPILATLPAVSLGGVHYFAAEDFVWGDELWKTDGTTAGTQRVTDLWPGEFSFRPEFLTPFGSFLLFSASDGTHGKELWKSDGTAAGTVLVKDVVPGSFGSMPAELTLLGSVVLFTADNGISNERDLWRTDGTEAGTVLLKTAAGGLVRVGDDVVFLASEPLTGRELWITDGTAAGTARISDVRPGAASGFPPPPLNGGNTRTVVGSRIFVLADGFNGRELFVAGRGGTASVHDNIYPGPRSPDIDWMTTSRRRLFFVADDSVHGRELWVTDGSFSNTQLLKDIVPGPGSPVIQFVTAMGRHLLFSADDGVHGVELWVSDGTDTGTVLLQDIAPGPASSSPMGFFSAFPNIYFVANDNVSGFELWALPWAALGSTFADVPVSYWAWRFIEALADSGLTGGCNDGLYCPTQTVTRAEMSAFITRGVHGGDYVPPPATGTRFEDVPADFWAAPWIEQFAAEGFTSGCSATPPLFCPETPVPRAQMAVFLLRALHGASYMPPPATGTVFQDVPAGYWAAAWIEQLAAEGITAGCAPNLYCPEDPVGRDQMAVFLTRAFKLPFP